MEPTTSPSARTKPSRARAWLITAAAMTGVAIGAAGVAGAATNNSTSSTSTSSGSASAPAEPATLSHGPNETLLTGTTAEKVKAAALAAVPGATVVRVETDSAGSPYEAHLKKSDGTYVTVKVDSSFKVTATQSGFGGGPGGAPAGAPPASGSTGA
jgi:hypothetical protein